MLAEVVASARGLTGAHYGVTVDQSGTSQDFVFSDLTPEQLLETVTFRRSDGRDVSLGELPPPQLLAAGETVRAEEVELLVPDGRSVRTLVNATPIRADGGAIRSVVVTLQDLAPLGEIDRLRTEFLGLVSHELREPLAAIKGSAATLLEEAARLDPVEMREFHRIMSSRPTICAG